MRARTPGFSQAAIESAIANAEPRRYLMQSRAFASLADELAAVYEECRHAGWDGYSALPITPETHQTAYGLLELWPLSLQPPSIGAEPDGSLTFEWHKSTRRTLSVSVSDNGELYYAALLGPNRHCGAIACFGEMPTEILRLVRAVHSK